MGCSVADADADADSDGDGDGIGSGTGSVVGLNHEKAGFVPAVLADCCSCGGIGALSGFVNENPEDGWVEGAAANGLLLVKGFGWKVVEGVSTVGPCDEDVRSTLAGAVNGDGV